MVEGLPALQRGALALAAAAWLPRARPGLTILIHHRVLPRADPIFPDIPDALAFERQMALLASEFNVLPLAEALAALRRSKLPPRAVAITFDDGYADNEQVALPILRRHGLHATFFVAAGFIDGGRMWNDVVIEAVRRAPPGLLDLDALGLGRHHLGAAESRRAAVARLLGALKYLEPAQRQRRVETLDAALPPGERLPLMMTSAQVRSLHAAGMDIGGHTVNHPILARLDAAAARAEIAGGRERLIDMICAPVSLFAYPNGRPGKDYAPEHVRMVRELGFTTAVSTAWGAARADDDYFQLPRFTPWDRAPFRFALRLLRNYRVHVECPAAG